MGPSSCFGRRRRRLPTPTLARSLTPRARALTTTENPKPTTPTNSTGATLINEDGDGARAHGGAHVTALAWVEEGAGGAQAQAPPRLLSGGLDKHVRLWAGGAAKNGAAPSPSSSSSSRLAPLPTASWQAPKKVSAVAAVDVGGMHAFFADRYGDVLSAPLPPPLALASAAVAGGEAQGGGGQKGPEGTTDNAPPLPSAFALGHLSSAVSRVLAVPEGGGGGGGPDHPHHHHPALVATADADGKVRLSRVPPTPAFLARHGCPDVQAYGLGHQSAVVDLALLMLPAVWVYSGGGGGSVGSGEGATPPPKTTTPVIVSGSADGTVRLWCPATGRELCRAVVSEEEDAEAEEEEQVGEGDKGEDGDSSGSSDSEGGGGNAKKGDDKEEDEEAAAARQAMERMQRLEAALSPGEDDFLRDPCCPSVAAVAAAAGNGVGGAPGGTPPLVAAAVEGRHAVAVFAVELGDQGGSGSRLHLRLLRRSPVPGVRFPTSLQFAPAPAAAAAADGGSDAPAESRPLLLWAAGGWPSAALLAGAPVSGGAAAAADADASADVGAVDALTGEEAEGVVVAAGLGVLRRREEQQQQGAAAGEGEGQGDDGPGPGPSSSSPYPVPLLWQRREAERRRQGRAHGPHLKRGRTDFAETARLARLHGGAASGGGGGGGGEGAASQ